MGAPGNGLLTLHIFPTSTYPFSKISLSQNAQKFTQIIDQIYQKFTPNNLRKTAKQWLMRQAEGCVA